MFVYLLAFFSFYRPDQCYNDNAFLGTSWYDVDNLLFIGRSCSFGIFLEKGPRDIEAILLVENWPV